MVALSPQVVPAWFVEGVAQQMHKATGILLVRKSVCRPVERHLQLVSRREGGRFNAVAMQPDGIIKRDVHLLCGAVDRLSRGDVPEPGGVWVNPQELDSHHQGHGCGGPPAGCRAQHAYLWWRAHVRAPEEGQGHAQRSCQQADSCTGVLDGRAPVECDNLMFAGRHRDGEVTAAFRRIGRCRHAIRRHLPPGIVQKVQAGLKGHRADKAGLARARRALVAQPAGTLGQVGDRGEARPLDLIFAVSPLAPDGLEFAGGEIVGAGLKGNLSYLCRGSISPHMREQRQQLRVEPGQ